MDISQPVTSEVTAVGLNVNSETTAKAISVKAITNPEIFDSFGRPSRGGLYDPALGPFDKNDVCETCELTYFSCSGHFGHIDLPQPVYNPLFFSTLGLLLRGTCSYCFHLKVPEYMVHQWVAKLSLISAGHVVEAKQIDRIPYVAAEGADDLEGKGKRFGKDSPDLVEAYRTRLHAWVERCKKRGSKHTKDTVMEAEKQRLVESLLRSIKEPKRCHRCWAHTPVIKTAEAAKISESALAPKHRAENESNGLYRLTPDEVLALAGGNSAAKASASEPVPENSTDDNKMDDDSDSESDSSQSDASDSSSKSSRSSRSSDHIDSPASPVSSPPDSPPLKPVRNDRERLLHSREVRARVQLLFKQEQGLMDLLFAPAQHPGAHAFADMFFLEAISVPPSRFRPASVMGDSVFEHPQNVLLSAVLKEVAQIHELKRRLQEPTTDEFRAYAQRALLERLMALQVSVNSMIDNKYNKSPMPQGKSPPNGVKQLLEKKEGLFRMNMMGKRVNYAARSVISPDVNIETNEIGVPPVFATKLTYPEPVTSHNAAKLRQMVINGPRVHPGASFVQTEDGTLISLERMSETDRIALASKLLTPDSRTSSGLSPDIGIPQNPSGTQQVNRKVYRHLIDGDVVILNRQPTLHKPSMMCHIVKVLRGEKTIRMHYANCNSYNADFDGDEMNMHFPQSPLAQAEARFIANTDNQYLTPTSGAPLRGLIQDHVVAGVVLTGLDSFFTREQYQQLIFGALKVQPGYLSENSIRTLPPAIFKPRRLWTGKQIVSTILLNLDAHLLNLTSKCKVPGPEWGPLYTREEQFVVKDGYLCTGVLDKAQIGASAYGLVHASFELLGPEAAGKLLSVLSRLLTLFNQHYAFTCRMDDLLLNESGNRTRNNLLSTVNDRALNAALDFVGINKVEFAGDSSALSASLRERLRETLFDDTKLAGLDASIEGEANFVTTQINKDCLPAGLARPFPQNHMRLMTMSGAKGSNVNASQISCLLGQQSLEGRRVPLMVSGKSLPSFKAFETAPRAGGFVSGRFLTGIAPQEYYFHCMAGREGLIDTAVKTSRSGYLQRCIIKHLEGIKVHYDYTVRNADDSVIQFLYGEDGLDVVRQKYLPKQDFAAANIRSLLDKLHPEQVLGKVDDLDPKAMKRALHHPESHLPVISSTNPSRALGCVSEKFAADLNAYVKENPHSLLRPKHKPETSLVNTGEMPSASHFKSLRFIQYMRALVDPGEAVGLLAGQGIGEPSTQMTLNTFHFAGHGAANVTLGIPRLREIIMTAASKIQTPTMTLPVLPDVPESAVSDFCVNSSRLYLASLVKDVVINERILPPPPPSQQGANPERKRQYAIRVQLFPHDEYEREYQSSRASVLRAFVASFLPHLQKLVTAQLKVSGITKGDMGKARKASKATESFEDDEGNPDGAFSGNDDVNENVRDNDEKDDERLSDESDDEGKNDDDAAKRQDDAGAFYGEEDDASDSGNDSLVDIEAVSADSDSESDNYDEASFARKFAPKRHTASAPSSDPVVDEASAAISKDDFTDLVNAAYKRAPLIAHFNADRQNAEWVDIGLEFSADSQKLLLVGIVEEACKRAVVRSVPGITRAFAPKGQRSIVCEGSNLQAIWDAAYGVVDLDNIVSNDIAAILNTYGVEAAREAIIREISAVFNVYSIAIDYRHLSIVADYMTSEGGFKPFNRFGLKTSPSPFLKASFETSANFVSDAALHGDFDDLTSPAASIVLGQPPKSGTGAFDVMAYAPVSY